jgi:uncharacterized protein YdcH (DUF465 family)
MESTEITTTTEMPTLIMQALPANALELAMLAGEINFMESVRLDMIAAVNDAANKTLVHTAKLGAKIKQASEKSEHGFNHWLADNCPAISRTNAYNYMAIAREMPYLLDDSIVQTSGQLSRRLSPSQVNALISAPDELKMEVSERVESGEKVSVNEINRLKKEKQQADEDYLKVAAENLVLTKDKSSLEDALDDLERENKNLKTGAGIDNLVRQVASTEIEKTQVALQKELDRVITEHERDYQASIDHLNDTVSRLRNELVKAKNPEILEELNQEIADAQAEIAHTQRRLERANAEVAYRGIATHVIETSASISISLLDLGGALIIESATTELLLRAAHDLSGIVELLQKAATVEQFDIEG